MRKATIVLASALLALALGIAGCGSSTGSGSTNETPVEQEEVNGPISASDIEAIMTKLKTRYDEKTIYFADIYTSEDGMSAAIVGLWSIDTPKGVLDRCGFQIDIEKEAGKGKAKMMNTYTCYEPDLGSMTKNYELQEAIQEKSSDSYYMDIAAQCIEAFSDTLYDPYSAHFSSIRSYQSKDSGFLGDGRFSEGVLVDFDVNAKNKLGGYVGDEHYYFKVHDNGTIEQESGEPMYAGFDAISDTFRKTFEAGDLGLE